MRRRLSEEVRWRGLYRTPLQILVKIWTDPAWQGASIHYEDGHHILTKGAAVLRIKEF